MNRLPHAALLLLVTALNACSVSDGGVDLRNRNIVNRLAYIPSQCFTRTHDGNGQVAQNPCYVCHANAAEPNQQSQPELQMAYAFPQVEGGREVINPWTNLFVDRRAAIDQIGDDAVSRYVATDNYHDERGRPQLAKVLQALPKHWDVNGDGQWNGYRPDAALRYDAQGYDIDAAGHASGWRRFAYYPLPGSFMPTNGAFDDVLIRLPAAFRQRADGQEDRGVYTVNLAIVEALIKRRDVYIDAVDEHLLGIDLDGDGKLGMASRVHFDWNPLQNRFMSYVGRARDEQTAGRVHLAAGLYPEGTEFLHSVRYLQVNAQGQVRAAPRMKELRYSRKDHWLNYSDLRHDASLEAREAELNPNRYEQYLGNPEQGLQNVLGWTYQGFIEDAQGWLRPQTREETVACMGCHTGIAATEDSSFALPRKLSAGVTYGWGVTAASEQYALPDPRRADGQAEFATYLRANHAGDEFRSNAEVKQRFFSAAGEENAAAFVQLDKDISTLLLPSAARALALNKAYWLLVREQSFAKGREPMLAPAINVHREIRQDTPTSIVMPLESPRLQL